MSRLACYRLPLLRPSARLMTLALAIPILSLALATEAPAQSTDDGLDITEPASVFTGLAQAPEANLFVGSATTAIPIDAPPGRKSVTPNLALRYRSGSGPGPYGHGWDLPIGRIRRSAKLGVVPCEDALARREFVVELPAASIECRLAEENGNRVPCHPRVEESYARVYFVPADNHWEVFDRNGMHYRFGVSADGRTGAIRDRPWRAGDPCRYTDTWELQQVVDGNGNHIDVEYDNVEGIAYPVAVLYGGNLRTGFEHVFEIGFLWQERPIHDRPLIAVGGHPARLSRLLDKIEVRYPAAGPPVRTYDLTYDLDLEDRMRSGRTGFLQAVTLLGRNGTALQRFDGLPASTIFTYHTSSPERRRFLASPVSEPAVVDELLLQQSQTTDQHHRSKVALRDMNADGFIDLVDARGCNSNWSRWQVYYGSADGFADEPVEWKTGGSVHGCGITVARVEGDRSRTFVETVDVTGDGIPDWIEASLDIWWVQRGRIRADGSGFFDQRETWPARVRNRGSLGFLTDIVAIRVTEDYDDWLDLFDWNGDGLPDMVNAREGRVRLNTGHGFEHDGIAVPFPEFRLRRTRNRRLVDGIFDMNGDGLPDRVREASATQWDVWLHHGTTLAPEPEPWKVPETCARGMRDRSSSKETVRDLIDLSGDGLPDLVDTCTWTPEAPYWTVYVNRGSAFASVPQLWQSPFAALRFEKRGSSYRTYRDLVDLDGDGRLDLVDIDEAGALRLYRNDTGFWLTLCEGNCRDSDDTAAPEDFLVGIENATGARAALAYAPSTNWDNTDSVGIPRLPGVLWTLTRVARESGMHATGGGTRQELRIRYAYGRFDPPTREFRGFGTVQTTQPDGSRETTVFAQGYADRGRVLTTSIHAPGNDPSIAAPLRATANDWECFSTATGTSRDCDPSADAADDIGIRLRASHVFDYGSDGSRRHAWREQVAWDAYGNATVMRAGGDDASTITTRSEFVHADDIDSGGNSFDVAKPSYVEVGSGRASEATWYFYDDLPLGQLARGNLTRVESWLDHSVVAVSPCTDDTRRDCVATRIRFDEYGNPTATTDPAGRTTSTEYGPAHIHPAREIDAAGHVVELEYDLGCGKPLRTSLPDSGAASRHGYDDFCRLRASALPGQEAATPQKRIDYYLGAPGTATDIAIRELEPTSPTGWRSVHELYDGFGRLLQRQRDAVVDGARVVIATDTVVYDNRDRPVIAYPPTIIDQNLLDGNADYRSTGSPAASRFWYDALGRLTRTVNPNLTERQAAYTTAWRTETTGECFHASSCAGARTVEDIDAHGRVVEKRSLDESGATMAATRYTYDVAGRQTSVRQWDGQRWAGATTIDTKYDSLGRKIEIDDPDSGRWRYGYDAVGNLVYQDDPVTGRHIEMCWDSLNRLRQKHVVEGTDNYSGGSRCDSPELASERYEYDDDAVPFGVGRLTRVDDESGFTLFHAYDARGNAVLVEKGIHVDTFVETATTSYTYDSAGHLLRVVYPDGERLRYEYDEAGRVRSALVENDGTVILTDLTYDEYGRPRQITHGNGDQGVGIVDQREYHDKSELFRLARLTILSTGDGRGACALGNRLADRRIDRYTANGRISQVVHESACGDLADTASTRYDGMGRLIEITGGSSESFSYDPLGNVTGKGGSVLDYAASRPHRPLSVGDEDLEYDRNGNRITRGNHVYRYDAEDRLVSIDRGAVRIAYDYSGTRVRRDAGNIVHRHFNELADFRIEGGHPILTKHYFAGDLRLASREAIWRPQVRDAEGTIFATADRIDAFLNGARALLASLLGISLVGLALWPDRDRRRRRPGRGIAVAVLVAFCNALLVGSAAPALANGGPGAKTVPLPTVIAEPVDLTFHHYHVDERGTPIVITDERGRVVQHLRYRAYGAVRGRWDRDGAPDAPSSRFGFAGYDNVDDTDLQYAGVRWYDADLGMFLTHDPARQFPSPYLYGGGDPINGVDHAGAVFGVDDLLVAIAIGIAAGAVGSGVQAAINGASVGKAFEAAAIGGAIGGASAFVGAGILGPALSESVIPSLAGQLVNAGIAAETAPTVAGVVVYGSLLGSGVSQAGYQASRGNWGPLIGLGVAIGLSAAIAPPAPSEPASGLRTVSSVDRGEPGRMSVADLRTGDVLITQDGAMASVTGHSAVVLDAEGTFVRVLSADNRGQYIGTNLDPAVGGRQWDVFRIANLDEGRLRSAAQSLASQRGLKQYIGNQGANVCSSTCARAIESAGGPVAPRIVGGLVTPAALRRTYGPPIGRVYVPKLGSI